MLLNARQISGQAKASELILLAIEDITVRKQAEQEFVKRAELQRSPKELLSSSEVHAGASWAAASVAGSSL
jgi:hypothetical protein